jgi:hypothetical protein
MNFRLLPTVALEKDEISVKKTGVIFSADAVLPILRNGGKR